MSSTSHQHTNTQLQIHRAACAFDFFRACPATVMDAVAYHPVAQTRWRCVLLTLHIYSGLSSTIFTVIIWPGSIFQHFILKELMLMCPLWHPHILAGSQHCSPAVCWSTSCLDELFVCWSSSSHRFFFFFLYLLYIPGPCVCVQPPWSLAFLPSSLISKAFKLSTLSTVLVEQRAAISGYSHLCLKCWKWHIKRLYLTFQGHLNHMVDSNRSFRLSII